MKKRGTARSKLIYFITTGVLLLAVFGRYLPPIGSNSEKAGDGTYYYYFPENYISGAYSFGEIRSKERDGAKIEYRHKLLVESEMQKYTNTMNNLPVAFAETHGDIGKNLYGLYWEDGRLLSVVYNDTDVSDNFRGLTGKSAVRRCLMLKFYDDDGKRKEDSIADCAECFANDIAESIRLSHKGLMISRIFIVCRRDAAGTCVIDAYISPDERDFDAESCENVTLMSAGGIDCNCYLRAIIFSDGGNEDNMRLTAEKTAELLNTDHAEQICAAEGYAASVIIQANQANGQE